MSSKGEIFGGLGGIAIASVPGAWGIGAFGAFQVGAAVGGMLFPADVPNIEQGRLSDVRGTGSAQGIPIPKVYGRQRVGGVLFYASSITEINKDSGGGGKK